MARIGKRKSHSVTKNLVGLTGITELYLPCKRILPPSCPLVQWSRIISSYSTRAETSGIKITRRKL